MMKMHVETTAFFLGIIMLCVLACSPSMAKSRKDEPIPASIKLLVIYGKDKNRESYRSDIFNVLDNYLMRSQCFEKVVTDEQQKADLILEAIIDELTMMREYGASLGDILSEYGDPDAKTRLTVSYRLRIQLFLRKAEKQEDLFAERIDVNEFRNKMYPSEDTEKYAWESVLAGVEREAEKKICGKKGKIMKAMFKK